MLAGLLSSCSSDPSELPYFVPADTPSQNQAVVDGRLLVSNGCLLLLSEFPDLPPLPLLLVGVAKDWRVEVSGADVEILTDDGRLAASTSQRLLVGGGEAKLEVIETRLALSVPPACRTENVYVIGPPD
ncbi:MAG: hypothetical protein ACR2JP_07055 [Acidimicrobiia bacterium]